MIYSDFINETLHDKNNINWDYYGIVSNNVMNSNDAFSFISQYFEYGGKNLPLIINPAEAQEFIEEFFSAGSKATVISFINVPQYFLPKERATHTVSGFFLGFLIENCLNGNNTLSITYPHEFSFSYLWFLTFLYHDYGYCVAEKTNSPLGTPTKVPLNYIQSNTYNEYKPLKSIKEKLGISLSPFSMYNKPSYNMRNNHVTVSIANALLRELTQDSLRIPKAYIQFNNGSIVNKHRYSNQTVTRYFNYCINIHEKYDHGIIGGFLFYDRIIKNYAISYLRAINNNHQNANIDPSDFIYNTRHFCQSQLPIFSYISDCIISHNIWKEEQKHIKEYMDYGIHSKLGAEFRSISFDENPLLYILVITDSIEPLKAYADFPPEVVVNSIDIKYLPGSRTITFSSISNLIDITILYNKAKDLEAWTTVQCLDLVNGKFSINI